MTKAKRKPAPHRAPTKRKAKQAVGIAKRFFDSGPFLRETPAEQVAREASAPDVARLLAASLQAHEQAKAHRRGKRVEQAREALTEAARLRREAHALDPEHTAPVWAEEQAKTPRGRDTHLEMLTFYTEQGV